MKHAIGNSATYRAYDCRKVLALFLHDWLKKPTPIPTQSEATTAIVFRSHTFSRASRQLQVNFDQV